MKPLIVGNWKCNPESLKEAQKLFLELNKRMPKKAQAVVCLSFIFLKDLAARKSALQLGAQNCFYQSGAFTGEISVKMLKNLGVKYVIIGHSERRALGETDKLINLKLKAVLKEKLIPILCIGESKKDRQNNRTALKLKNQLKKDLKGIKFSKMVIAYEPIWAIGSNNPCRVEEATVTKLLIKKYLREVFSNKKAEEIKILYGGSVNKKNASLYIKDAKMDGLLIGGASLKAKEFIDILKQFC